MKSTQEITQEVRELGQWIPALRQQVGHVVIGQKYLVDRLLLGLLANGHLLLEGVPGLAKTLTVKTMAACIQTGFPDRKTCTACRNVVHRRIWGICRLPGVLAVQFRIERTARLLLFLADSRVGDQARGPTVADHSFVPEAPSCAPLRDAVLDRDPGIPVDGISPPFLPKHPASILNRKLNIGKQRSATRGSAASYSHRASAKTIRKSRLRDSRPGVATMVT